MGTDTARADRTGYPELDSALGHYQTLTTELDRVSADLATLRVTGRAADGSVTAVVDARGELIAVTIEPTAAARLDPKALAARVVEASTRACAEVRERAHAAVADLLPERLRTALRTDGSVDIARFMPPPGAFDVRSGGR